ncbi:pyridoxamine 5'-phosphate oxidase [Bermanella marisrubri]|uniref:Pyridoxine/pyridoxamine 5'-phosphate oxidase n=1 Tax=Bermanella marisrubri TaxID=207949 RepID=Q1N1P0_9GAMM|nr:pyridoxamine 5'-phosphate oxidase [Bermanella marisrubri]EAT12241.1 pyridoxamine 5'-phosphate oxidase [Oceanobacter sp. RED65] [Bermanella marisrubri]QIZ83709.1 pyridoxamine 5'-phosphate oxidase [Bermanella marisrubri]
MDISNIRRQYGGFELHREDLDDNPIAQFKHWLGQAIDSELFKDPTAMNIATVDEDGMPCQRIVLLKNYDEKGFVFYTNLESQKAQHIANNSQVCLHFGWLELERQVIIRGRAEKLSVAENTEYFLSRPHDSQLAAWASAQSKPITGRKMLEQAFSQMKHKFQEGKVPLPGFWGGYRIVPERIEFWQGRVNRLHDRFLYRKTDSGWNVERLQP